MGCVIECPRCGSQNVELLKSRDPICMPGTDEPIPGEKLRCREPGCGLVWWVLAITEMR